MFPAIMLAASLATGAVVEAHLEDGQLRVGELLRLSSDAIELQLDDGRLLPLTRQAVDHLLFPAAAGRTSEALRSFVELVDGSRVAFPQLEMSAGQIRVPLGGDQPAWSFPVAAVRAIRWVGPESDEQWNAIADKQESSDLLVIRRTQGALDYLKGVVQEITQDQVTFVFGDTTVPAPLSRVAGVILFRRQGKLPEARLRLSCRDGSAWMLEAAELVDRRIRLASVAGVQREIPLDDVSRLDFPRLDAVFLTDLSPTSIAYTPYFQVAALDEALAQLRAPTADRSFAGDPLRIQDSTNPAGQRQFPRGLAVRSRTQLDYRLAGGYRRFQAVAGIDPSAPIETQLQLTVFADDEPRLSVDVSRSDDPVDVDVDVSGARRLRILVDFGDHLDIGDRLHLGDARLIK